MRMKYPVKVDMAINEETKRYFEFITRPIELKAIIPLKNLINLSQDENLTRFWKALQQKNLECFQLVCGEIQSPVDVFYIDLETPVIFQPLLNNSITLKSSQKFSSMVKNIKSNLMRFYNQEIESLFILIKKDTNKEGEGVSYYTYKIEDQNIKSLLRP
ncbi:MAG: hypothetical protein ACFFDC_17445, partial [Promethearchaeota archaeon]